VNFAILDKGSSRDCSRLLRFAQRIRVQHKVQNRNGLTKSSGIRGGSQSVVSRTESCQAFNFFMRWRGVPWRHQGWQRFFAGFPFACRASSQPNNSRAWGSRPFLDLFNCEFNHAHRITLSRNQAGGKPVLSATAGTVNKRKPL
jgi:hypothetical protein